MNVRKGDRSFALKVHFFVREGDRYECAPKAIAMNVWEGDRFINSKIYFAHPCYNLKIIFVITNC